MKPTLSALAGLCLLAIWSTAWGDKLMFGIAIHGGAGTMPRAEITPELEAQYRADLARALDEGYRLLEGSGTSEDAAIAAVQRGVDKGQLRDPGNAQLMLGIAHYNQKRYSEAVPYFNRARQSDKHRQIADSYLQAIQAQS